MSIGRTYGVIDEAASLVGSRRISRRIHKPLPGAARKLIEERRRRYDAQRYQPPPRTATAHTMARSFRGHLSSGT